LDVPRTDVERDRRRKQAAPARRVRYLRPRTPQQQRIHVATAWIVAVLFVLLIVGSLLWPLLAVVAGTVIANFTSDQDPAHIGVVHRPNPRQTGNGRDRTQGAINRPPDEGGG